ncbi:MAG: hypothetical protein HYS33_08840 [Acidobacteria bacterium]|nr:hypothetical protein [Acidobacteriota bacterium]
MRKSWKRLSAITLLLMVAPLAAEMRRPRPAKVPTDTDVKLFRESWRVLKPITRGSLSIFPVASALKVDTSGFLTLDDGLASGAVRIMERGQIEPAMMRRRTPRWPGPIPVEPRRGGASVNELVLVNDSPRPLILLAGEVVSGGKQNRVIGADLVVPPKSDPLPLTVFCVEHGRWSAGGGGFGSAKLMAHPEIRKQAQIHKSQQGVWDSVARSAVAAEAAATSSDYADVMNSPRARRDWGEIAASIESDYERELREQLRGQDAVGVVVAIDGEMVWSDVFSSADLFRKYWPKLLRSYVVEAQGRGDRGTTPPWREKQGVPSPEEARKFLLQDQGHVTIKTEPGAYRRTEISAREYQIVALEALGKSEDSGLLVHYNKMARD